MPARKKLLKIECQCNIEVCHPKPPWGTGLMWPQNLMFDENQIFEKKNPYTNWKKMRWRCFSFWRKSNCLKKCIANQNRKAPIYITTKIKQDQHQKRFVIMFYYANPMLTALDLYYLQAFLLFMILFFSYEQNDYWIRWHCITHGHDSVIDITKWAQEYFQKPLSVNTICICQLKLCQAKRNPYVNMFQKHPRVLWAKAHLK